MRTPFARHDLILLAASAILVLTLLFGAAPLAPDPVRTASPPDAFDSNRAAARLERILGDQRPHPVDTVANDLVRARLLAELQQIGLTPEVRDDFSCSTSDGSRSRCARVRNIIARVVGGTGKATLVSAHYDSVPAGPGASDDGFGVAVALEIAALVKANPTPQPVIVLLTDGEEAGLLGARAFAATDPAVEEIGAVVNVEARGVRGLAAMFETSHPNARDVAAYAKTPRPFANALMTDVYRLLPNDTDVSLFLPKGWDALNIAIIGGDAFYHTPHDNLAAFSRSSLQHAGDAALASVRGFASVEPAREGRQVFVDIVSRLFVAVPLVATLVALGLGTFAAVFGLATAGDGRIRATLAAFAAPIGAFASAFGAKALIDALRSEAAYWLGYPQAIQSLVACASVLATLLAVRFVAGSAPRRALIHAGWLVFAISGVAAAFAMPGASIFFAPPLALYAVLILMRRFASDLAYLAPATTALLLFAPSLAFAHVALGHGMAIAFAPLIALLLLLVLAPLLDSARNYGAAAHAGAGAAMLAAFAATLFAPGASAANPAPLNLIHQEDAEGAMWLAATADAALPRPLGAAAPFQRRNVALFGRPTFAAPAPPLGLSPPALDVLEEAPTDDGGRRVRVALRLNGADEFVLRAPADAKVRAVESEGLAVAPSVADGPYLLRCTGRACEGRAFTFTLGSSRPSDWRLEATRFGLPPEAAPLQAARPAARTPIQDGDRTVVMAQRTL